MPGFCALSFFWIGAWIGFVCRFNLTCRYAVKCFHLNINKSNLKNCFQILFEFFRLPLFLMLWLFFLNITHHSLSLLYCLYFFPFFPLLSPTLHIFVCFIFSPPHHYDTSLSLSFISLNVLHVFYCICYTLSDLHTLDPPLYQHSSPPPCSPILWMWRKVLR